VTDPAAGKLFGDVERYVGAHFPGLFGHRYRAAMVDVVWIRHRTRLRQIRADDQALFGYTTGRILRTQLDREWAVWKPRPLEGHHVRMGQSIGGARAKVEVGDNRVNQWFGALDHYVVESLARTTRSVNRAKPNH
jgi:hypothetical protein